MVVNKVKQFVRTVKAGHVQGLPLDESITLVQFAYEELAAAEKVHQMILVDGYSLGYITVVGSFIKY